MQYTIAIENEGKPTKFVRGFHGNLNTRCFDISITSDRTNAFVYSDLEQCKQDARRFRAAGLNVKIFRAVAAPAVAAQ